MANTTTGFQFIEFNVTDCVAVLKLNRPEKLNSFNTAMHAEVQEALAQVDQQESIRALLLTGEGRGFCAGQDLSDRYNSKGNREHADQAPDLYASLHNFYNPLILSLTSLSKPTVCAVNGVAAGAGANIALACDLVVAAKSASFIQSFSNLGLIPDSGGTWVLPRLVGLAKARALCMLGTKVGADDAKQMNMIFDVFEDSSLYDSSMELAINLAKKPTYGLKLTKQALLASSSNDLLTQLELERDLQSKASSSLDYKEGVSAFKEKRSPNFIGR